METSGAKTIALYGFRNGQVIRNKVNATIGAVTIAKIAIKIGAVPTTTML